MVAAECMREAGAERRTAERPDDGTDDPGDEPGDRPARGSDRRAGNRAGDDPRGELDGYRATRRRRQLIVDDLREREKRENPPGPRAREEREPRPAESEETEMCEAAHGRGRGHRAQPCHETDHERGERAAHPSVAVGFVPDLPVERWVGGEVLEWYLERRPGCDRLIAESAAAVEGVYGQRSRRPRLLGGLGTDQHPARSDVAL